MIARVSITAREYRGGFSGARRSMNGVNSAVVWKRQPLATWTSSTARPFHSSAISARRLRRASGDRPLDPDRDGDDVAAGLRQLVQGVRRLLHLLVLEQAPDELGARILLGRLGRRRPR